MKRVIFVDDEKLIVESFDKLLRMEDIDDKAEITTFTSKSCGKETLKWVDDHKPDIAILDIILNGVSGIDIAEKIMKLYPDTKILFLTGCEDSSTQVKKVKELINNRPDLMYFNKLDDNWYDDIIDYIIKNLE